MRNIDEHTRSALDIDVFEKRRREGCIGSGNTAAFAFCSTRTHESRTALEHDLADISKVNVNKTMTEHDAADALHSITEDFVGHLESFIDSCVLVRILDEVQELLVFDNDDRIGSFAEGANAILSQGITDIAFEAERLRDNGNRKDAKFTGHGSNDRSCTRTGTTAHARRNEHEVGTHHRLFQVIDVFFDSLAAHFRVHTSTEISRALFTDKDLVVGETLIQSHSISIDGIVFYTFNIHLLHTVHSIAAGTADAKHLDLSISGWSVIARDTRLSLEVDVFKVTHSLSP